MTAQAGCLLPEDAQDSLQILSHQPQRLEPDQALEVILDEVVDGLPDGPGFRTTPPVSFELRATPEARVFRIHPLPAWPEGRMELGLEDGWFRPDGRAFSVDTATVGFEVRAPREPVVVQLRGPVGPAPLNIRVLALQAGRPWPEVPSLAFLADGQRYPAHVLQQWESELLVEVPASCPPRCPPRELVVEWDRGEQLFVPFGSEPDLDPPEVALRSIRPDARSVTLDFASDEPVWAELTVQGRTVPPSGPLLGHRGLSVQLGRPADGTVRVEGVLTDLAGQKTAIEPVDVDLPEPVRVRISEIVATPLRDWNDSESAGVPFDAWPGSGAVTETDEWVELINEGHQPIDLARTLLELRAIDGTPSITEIRSAPGLYFGSSGNPSAWAPGEALVVRPRGALSSTGLSIEVWSGPYLLDRVLLGEGAMHPGGSPPDTLHESVAWTGFGFRWCEPTPGDPRAPVRCRVP
ncbi:MAG: hypothetical protein ACFB9M_06685 [Myxococcota bacterium]